MSARVDLHILTCEKTKPEWLAQAMDSVSGQPVNLRVINNAGRSTGTGRAQAYRESTAEFVACLDDDGQLLPGAIAACIAALDADPSAVGAYTDALYMDESGRVLGPDGSTRKGAWRVEHSLENAGYTEHIAVMRRAATLPFLDELEAYTGMEQYFLHGMLATVGHWVHVEQTGYLFRLHPENTHNTIPIEVRNAARQLIRKRFTAAGHVETPRVDVHVLYCHEPVRWVEDALISLAAEPVNVHLCKGIVGHVGEARARAFEHGSAEFVSFVDGDDAVEPGCFAAALQVLDTHPEVVSTYCDVQVLDHDGHETGSFIKGPWRPWRQLWTLAEVHHCHVMRRAAVMPYLEELAHWESLEEWVLMGLLARHGVHWHIPRKLYRFRQHGAYQRAGSLITAAMRQRGLDLCGRALIDLHRHGVRQPEHGA